MDEEARRLQAVNRGDGAAPSTNRAKRIRDKFIASSVLMGHAITTWVEDFTMIPVELLEDQGIRVGSQIGKKLLGLEDEIVVQDEEIVTQLTQARQDEEEYSPEWIEEMEKMMSAYDKKKEIARGFDRPSFVLEGFECPDPFASQQTQPTDMAGGSGTTNNDDTAQDDPVGAADQGGDMPIQDQIGSDILITQQEMLGARVEKPSRLHRSGAATEVCTKKIND